MVRRGYDRSVLALKLKPVLAEKAKERQTLGLKSDEGSRTDAEVGKVTASINIRTRALWKICHNPQQQKHEMLRALKLKPLIAEKAKENLHQGNEPLQKSVNPVNTQKELAKTAGVSLNKHSYTKSYLNIIHADDKSEPEG